jgi:polyphosphate kinase
MEQELLRRKFGPPVRLEVASDIDSDLLIGQIIQTQVQVYM